MKVKASIKPLCDDCHLRVRRGRMVVTCKKDAKHKQRQG